MAVEAPTSADVVIEGVVRDRSFVGEMNPTILLVTPKRCLVLVPLTHAVRSRTSAASMGVLATLMDVGTSDPALAAARPDWTATQDLAIHGAAPLTEGPILVDCQLIRLGKKVLIVSADAYDCHGVEDFVTLQDAIDAPGSGAVTLAATGLVTFARIPGAAAHGLEAYNPGEWVGQIRHRPVPIPATGTIHDRMGLHVVDAASGQIELQRTPYVANTIGTINGGAQAMLLEAAAEAIRPGMVATDMQIHYLSQVKAGPARTIGTVVRDAQDHSVVNMRLVDSGNDDHLLGLATVTLRTQR